MEHLNNDPFIHQVIHSEYIDILHNKDNRDYHATASFNVGEFNVFGIEWYAGRIDFFVNGQKNIFLSEIENAGSIRWPFDQEFYIILDQALGGEALTKSSRRMFF